ncbi:hypothetical protein BHM03_00054720, partial [Ensete ventricosum]
VKEAASGALPSIWYNDLNAPRNNNSRNRRYTLLLVGPPLHSFGRETADALNYSLSAGRYTLLAS